MKRRNFIKKASATGLGLVAISSSFISYDEKLDKKEDIKDEIFFK